MGSVEAVEAVVSAVEIEETEEIVEMETEGALIATEVEATAEEVETEDMTVATTTEEMTVILTEDDKKWAFLRLLKTLLRSYTTTGLLLDGLKYAHQNPTSLLGLLPLQANSPPLDSRNIVI